MNIIITNANMVGINILAILVIIAVVVYYYSPKSAYSGVFKLPGPKGTTYSF